MKVQMSPLYADVSFSVFGSNDFSCCFCFTFNKAVDIADRILKISPSPTETFAVSNKKEQSLESTLFREIQKLNEIIDRLSISSGRSPYHRNENSRESNTSNKRDFSICWVHRRLGKKKCRAEKCVQPCTGTILDRVLGARAAKVHYRLFSVWTLVPVRLGKQLFDNSTVDEIASEAADCRLTYTMANCPQRRLEKPGKKGRRTRKRKKELEKTRAGRFRKRRGESQSFLFRDADQESKTRMRNNALRTGPRQAVEWPEAIPIPDMQAKSLCRTIFETWVSHFGCPSVLTSDQGTQMRSSMYAEFIRMLGTEKIKTTTYHPISNGIVERFHRHLKSAIKAHENDTLSEIVPIIFLDIRTAVKISDYPKIMNFFKN
ncbi:retrovirus-related Pol polyprotein from transposon 412 [Trichonephila clavipes]|nr:retrovirus-related Pol polyprotein from transposon 412 [Trichonephila clavipes]